MQHRQEQKRRAWLGARDNVSGDVYVVTEITGSRHADDLSRAGCDMPTEHRNAALGGSISGQLVKVACSGSPG
jgi:hypothetical protein